MKVPPLIALLDIICPFSACTWWTSAPSTMFEVNRYTSRCNDCDNLCHCHTCGSLTPHICIGPDAGPTTSYGYEWIDRPWQSDARNRLLAVQNSSFISKPQRLLELIEIISIYC